MFLEEATRLTKETIDELYWVVKDDTRFYWLDHECQMKRYSQWNKKTKNIASYNSCYLNCCKSLNVNNKEKAWQMLR